jgi:hypothetical protein
MPLIYRYSTKYDATSIMDMFKTIEYKGGKIERRVVVITFIRYAQYIVNQSTSFILLVELIMSERISTEACFRLVKFSNKNPIKN